MDGVLYKKQIIIIITLKRWSDKLTKYKQIIQVSCCLAFTNHSITHSVITVKCELGSVELFIFPVPHHILQGEHGLCLTVAGGGRGLCFTVGRGVVCAILLGGGMVCALLLEGHGLCQCETHFMTRSAVIVMSHVHLSISIHTFQMDIMAYINKA